MQPAFVRAELFRSAYLLLLYRFSAIRAYIAGSCHFSMVELRSSRKPCKIIILAELPYHVAANSELRSNSLIPQSPTAQLRYFVLFCLRHIYTSKAAKKH